MSKLSNQIKPRPLRHSASIDICRRCKTSGAWYDLEYWPTKDKTKVVRRKVCHECANAIRRYLGWPEWDYDRNEIKRPHSDAEQLEFEWEG